MGIIRSVKQRINIVLGLSEIREKNLFFHLVWPNLLLVCLGFNETFINISVIPNWSVLLVEEAGVPRTITLTR